MPGCDSPLSGAPTPRKNRQKDLYKLFAPGYANPRELPVNPLSLPAAAGTRKELSL
ncbi:MAG: hypothetical protein ACYDBB_23105 [Armatimonadota bacterium]